ncbi:MAG TPA: tetratricopeptide repeat protein [Candidatus Polarisedimenticolia bacterium]|nr:tetratricopeptide repeat protein [Candidatus Polarisedimenticolia bacterium]
MRNPLTTRTLPEWAQVAALALLALALRLLYVWQVHSTTLVVPEELDPALYYNWAKEIAAGDWLGKGPFVQSPLYAYLLGLMMKIIGTSVSRILVLQSFVGCGTVLLTYLAGRRLFGRRSGLLAGLLLALYGPFIFYEGMVMKTFLSPFLTILLVILLDRARERAEGGAVDGTPASTTAAGAGRAFALAGVVYGLLTLDRDNFILLAPVLAALAMVLGGGGAIRSAPTRRGVRAAGAFALGAVLVVAPVTLRNWAVAHELVLLTTGGGEVFFIGNNEDANGLYVPPAFVRPDPKYEHDDFIARASEISGRTLTPMQSSWFWFREGAKFIVGEPLAWARLLGLKMLHFWNYYELPDNLDYSIMQMFSPLLGRWLNVSLPPPGMGTLWLPGRGGWAPTRLHLFATFGTLAPLGLLGLYLTRRSWRRLLPLYVLLFGYMATVMLFFNFSRFRVPIVPILALFAAESLAALGRLAGRLWDLAAAYAGRAADVGGRARALLPTPGHAVVVALFVVVLLLVNVEQPRGAVPAIEQALVVGNAYYYQSEPEKALQSYMTGLLLLGEGPPGPEGEALLRRLGPGVTGEALRKELEVESIARGPQFKGIHLGIHHGIGIALLMQAQTLLGRGRRAEALPLIDRAIVQFQEALKLAPAYLLSIRKLARAYILKGDSATGIEWLNKGVDLWPEDFPIRLEIAEALYDHGDYEPALRNLDEARLYDKGLDDLEKSDIHFYRGLIYQRGLNDPAKALYDFERTLALNPSHPQASEIKKTIAALRASGVQPTPDEAPERPRERPATAPARPTAS